MIRHSLRKKSIHCNLSESAIAAASNPEAAVVIHAPMSCGVYAVDRFYHRLHRWPFMKRVDNIFVTGIGEGEAVFGGAGAAEACLRDVISGIRPEYVVLVPGCIPGIAGDDTESVGRLVEKETGLPVIVTKDAGFLSSQKTDFALEIGAALMRRFTFPHRTEIKKNEIAVLGMNLLTAGPAMADDLSLIFKGLGFEKVYFPPISLTRKEYEEMASVSAVYGYWRTEGKKKQVEELVEECSRQLDVPVLSMDIPDGVEKTEAFVRTLSEKLGRREKGERLIETEKEKMRKSLREAQEVLRGVRVSLVVGQPYSHCDFFPVFDLLQKSGAALTSILLLPGVEEEKFTGWLSSFGKRIPCPVVPPDRADFTGMDMLIGRYVPRIEKPLLILSYRRLGFTGCSRFLKELSLTWKEKRRMNYEKK